jgi:RNA polymerase sigma factor (sigma-70 family)
MAFPRDASAGVSREIQQALFWVRPLVRQTHRQHQQETNLSEDELFSDALLALYTGVRRSRKEFTPKQQHNYLKMHVQFAIWKSIRRSWKELKQSYRKSWFHQLLEQTCALDALIQQETHNTLNQGLDRYLTPCEADLVNRRYGLQAFKRHELQEIAEQQAITPQAVSNRERRILKRLRVFMERHDPGE